MAKTYREKLLDPRWQKKRLQVMQRAEFRCESCDNDDETLHVHHRYYIKGNEPWEYEDAALVCLCASCHTTDHSYREILNVALACIGQEFMDWNGFIGFACGYLIEQQPASQMSTVAEERLLMFGSCDQDAFDIGRKAHAMLGDVRLARYQGAKPVTQDSAPDEQA